MSIRMALAKLSAAVAGGALVGGGAVHVAEPSAKNQGYVKHVKQAKPVRTVKPRRTVERAQPRTVKRMRKIVKTFAYDTGFITEDLIKSRYEASVRPGYHESYAKIFDAPRQRHIKALATPEADIRKITQPALVIHGRDDRIVPLSNSLKLHSLIQKSDLHVFGECGHWTQIEKKDQFAKLVMDFFGS